MSYLLQIENISFYPSTLLASPFWMNPRWGVCWAEANAVTDTVTYAADTSEVGLITTQPASNLTRASANHHGSIREPALSI